MWWKDAVTRLPVDAGLTAGVYCRIFEQHVGVRGYTEDQWQVSMEKRVPGGHIAPPFCITDWSLTLCMVARTDVCFNGATPVAAKCMSGVISTDTVLSRTRATIRAILHVSMGQASRKSVVPRTANSFAHLVEHYIAIHRAEFPNFFPPYGERRVCVVDTLLENRTILSRGSHPHRHGYSRSKDDKERARSDH
jgi:hypothetical protein